MGSAAESELELWQTVRAIYRTALKRLNARLRKEHVTFSQYSVLIALSRNGPLPMSRLGEHMLVAPANVTGLVDRMEKKGFVRRRRDERDRRLYVIETTEVGAKIFRGISGRFRRYVAGLGQDLSREEIAITLSALQRMRQRVEELAEI